MHIFFGQISENLVHIGKIENEQKSESMATTLYVASVTLPKIIPFKCQVINQGDKSAEWKGERSKISPRDVDISSSEQHGQQQHEDEDGQRYVPPIQSGACSCLRDWKTTHEFQRFKLKARRQQEDQIQPRTRVESGKHEWMLLR